MKTNKIIASVVSEDSDGIGVEIYLEDRLLLDIFRDDTKKTRTVTFYSKDIPLEILEDSIEFFNKEIPTKFIE